MKEVELPFEPGQVPTESELIKKAASRLKIPAKFITGAEILRRSIDARGGRIIYRYLVRIAVDGETLLPRYKTPIYKNVHEATTSAIVVNFLIVEKNPFIRLKSSISSLSTISKTTLFPIF